MIKYVYYKIWEYFCPKGLCLDFQAETRGRSAVGSDAVDPHGHQQCYDALSLLSLSPLTMHGCHFFYQGPPQH